MLKISNPLKAGLIDNIPKNIIPLEQRLYKMGYRMVMERIVENRIFRTYFRGKKWHKVSYIVSDIVEPQKLHIL